MTHRDVCFSKVSTSPKCTITDESSFLVIEEETTEICDRVPVNYKIACRNFDPVTCRIFSLSLLGGYLSTTESG